MGKVAFLFAGQGAQHPGMGAGIAAASPAARAVFDAADSVRPHTFEQCRQGTKEELSQTENTQPCVYATDLACARALEERGVEPDVVAGFSLGEVAALTFAGAFSDKKGFELVCRRAELMAAAASSHPGAMRAVVKLDAARVEELAAEAGINPNTVQRAFSELEREGLIYTQRATGKYVTENADEIKSARQALAKTQVAEFLSNMQSLGYSVGDVIVLLQSFNESEEESSHADSGM